MTQLEIIWKISFSHNWTNPSPYLFCLCFGLCAPYVVILNTFIWRCNIDRLKLLKKRLPIPEPFPDLWLKITKIIGIFCICPELHNYYYTTQIDCILRITSGLSARYCTTQTQKTWRRSTQWSVSRWVLIGKVSMKKKMFFFMEFSITGGGEGFYTISIKKKKMPKKSKMLRMA